MGRLIAILFIFSLNIGFSQETNSEIKSKLIIDFSSISTKLHSIEAAQKLASEWLQTNPQFQHNKGALSLLSKHKTTCTIHYRFQLIVNKLPINGGQIKICTNLEGDLISVAASNYIFETIEPQFSSATEYILINDHLIATSEELELTKNGLTNIVSYKDKNGEKIKSTDFNLNKSDTTIHVQVFFPEPITSAKSTYGSPYIDNNDGINAQLLNEYFIKEMPLAFRDDSFRLESEYFKMNEHSLPNDGIWRGISDTLLFNRSDTLFEQINAFYHLSRFRLHMDSLGYDTLGKIQINVDAHGFSGADASVYSSNFTPPRLTFGQGGVDDAEDPGIVIHEYTHALSDFAAPKSNIGAQRTAIDEGISDYIALSYLREISKYLSSDIFKWDGHNEFWSGRKINPKHHYPEDTNGTPHVVGGLLTVILFDISNEIGRNNTDKMAFEVMYDFMPGLTYPQLAKLLIGVEKNLFNEKYKREVCDALWNHGLIDACYVGFNEIDQASTELIVLNSERFAKRESELQVILPTKNEIYFEIVNTSGQVLKKNKSEIGILKLSPSNFNSGIYFIRFPKENFKTTKFLIY